MLPFIIGGVALAATGYGLKKYCEESEGVCFEKTYISFCEWIDNVGDKIADFGDSLLYDEKEIAIRKELEAEMEFYRNNLFLQRILGKEHYPFQFREKSVEHKLNVIHSSFYEGVVSRFLKVYGSLQNLPELNMENFYKLESRVENDISTITSESKEELNSYIMKFSRGVDAIIIELKDIELLQKENHDFNHFSKSTKRKIEDAHTLMSELIKVYNLKIINGEGKLEEEYKKALDSIELVADKII